MDIRGPRLRKQSERALAFTSSMAFDGRIARHVIAANMAHMIALINSGEVSREAGSKCLKFLLGASSEISPETKAEDFHQQLEQEAVDALGLETAGFLNYGKSRNDQVATAIRMELRLELKELLGAIAELQGEMLGLVGKHGAVTIPGYTHLQRAQPVTLAHHFFAHFDAFQRDIERTLQLYARVNLSPMGAAAMAGTAVKIDRKSVAESLGFNGIVRNAMDAVSARDTAVEALSCATMAMLDASRLAEELILWSTSEFGFIELDDAYAASSSIMPQKKNAVAAEMVRAKAGSVMGDLMAACAILKALPYSYNLDLQEVTPQVWRALDDTIDSIRVLAGMVSSASIQTDSLRRGTASDNSTAVALANYLVKEDGISFRQAHAIVGQLVRISVDTGKPLQEVAPSRMAAASAKFGRRITIDSDTAKEILDPGHFLEGIATEGGSNPLFVPGGLKVRQKDLSVTRSAISHLNSSLKSSERMLNRTASGMAREVKSRVEH
jgi:argininosuccinate lyase